MRLLPFLVLLCCTTTFADQPTAVVSLAGDRRLDVYSVDPDGKLVAESQTAIAAKPGTSCFDSTGRHLYVGSSDPETIGVFRSVNKQLTPLQSVAVPGKPSFLKVTPSGNFLLASYYATGQVTVHRIVGEGRLSDEPLQTLTVDPRAHCVMTDPDGRFVFVPHTSVSRISQFRFDETSGKLTPNDPPSLQRKEGVAPRHLWFHPKGKFAFGSNEQGRSISVYALDAKTGSLSETQTLSSMPDTQDKGTTSHVEATMSGKFVYIANRKHGTIAAWSFKAKQGKLSLLQHAKSPSTVRSFALSPDGNFLVAAGQKSSQLVCYRIASDGTLNQSDSQPSGKTPWWVSFSPTAGRNGTASPAVDFSSIDRSLMLGQGTMAGEVSDTTALLQTRLTMGRELDETGDLPGSPGVVQFEWSTDEDFADSKLTEFQTATPRGDFIVRSKLTHLQPDTIYFYRAMFGASKGNVNAGPRCTFRTLPGKEATRDVTFIVGSCMNYVKFMHGRKGNASGPLTATDEDKRLGFPAFESMAKLQPQFFVGTGDIVYYDNPYRVARNTVELRKCWHEQFRFPRMTAFFQNVPAYWSKDDHDFRYNDSDNDTDRLPLPQTGISMFREQLPIAESGDSRSPNYRTFRVSKDLQIWLTEGRDHRSANRSRDGAEKTMWGKQQRAWLQSTLAASDAKWKLMINPTPMVGPDDAYKQDNHANLKGFRHEADDFFGWVADHEIENLLLICGDRHWQYHSVHPTGIHEFACGALNDENSRMGVAPGDKVGSDPDARVRQLFTSPQPGGGFLQVEAGSGMRMTHYSDDGQQLYRVSLP